MAVEGTLDLFQLPEILQVISQQKKTGILTVQRPQDIVAVSFLSGRIVAVDSLNQPLEEGLAKVLLAEGTMTAADLARASADHEAAGKRLVDYLVEKGYLDRAQLLAALRLQTFRLLEHLLGWQEGDFKFFSGDEVSYEEGFQPISVEDLLIRSIQQAESARPAVPVRPRPAAPAPPAPSGEAGPAVSPPIESPTRPDLRIVARAVEEETVRHAGPVAPPVEPPAPREEAASPFRRMVAEDRSDALPKGARAGKLLAFGLAAATFAVAALGPASLSLPLPWQDRERESLEREQRAALFLKVDRAAKTYFLVRGQFPDRLADLVDAHLLTAGDLVDPSGGDLGYVAAAESYRIYPLRNRQPLTDAEVDESITGNFLLDPEFSSGRSESESVPLVLID